MGMMMVVFVLLALILFVAVVLPRVAATGGAAVGETGDNQASAAAGQETSALTLVAGDIRPGDVVSCPVDDPTAWGSANYDLDLVVAGVSQADYSTATGTAVWLAYWLHTGQEAVALVVDGDAPGTAQAHLVRLAAHRGLAESLHWCREQYLAEPGNTALEFDLTDHGLGSWAPMAVRQGILRVVAGTGPLLPAGTRGGLGLPYREFTLESASDSARRLRMLEIRDQVLVLVGDVLALRDVHVLHAPPEGPTARQH